MLNKELLLVSKRSYSLIYRCGAHKDTDYGYDSDFGQVLYDDVEANTSPNKEWKAFGWFSYHSDSNVTTIHMEYLGSSAPGSPRIFINGTLYQSDHGSIFLDGDPFDLVGLYKTGSPLYLYITWP
mgnify:CR=1 FL=1